MTGPFDALNVKRASGAKKVILGIGDSTFVGTGSGNDGGWLTRLAKLIGAADNCDVYWKLWDQNDGATGWPSTWTQIYSKSGGTAQPLYVYDGAIGGRDLIDQYQWLTGTQHFVAEQPDLIFQGSLPNDILQPSIPGYTDPGTYTVRYDAVIQQVQSQMPGVPMVIITQNTWFAGWNSTWPAYNVAEFQHLGVPHPSMPLSPALQQATAVSDIWVLDTRQAENNQYTNTYHLDAFHLNAAGNQLQADWMYAVIPVVGDTPVPPTISATSLGPLHVGTPREVDFTATGTDPITWTVSAGFLPTGMDLGPSTGVLSGTPAEAGSFDFTIRATNATGHDELRFTGAVTGDSFAPDTVVRPKVRLNDLWYPVRLNVRQSGSFIPVLPRA